jgi:hypothetical protein
MNQLNTSEEKLLAEHSHGMVFNNEGDTTSPSSEPCTPKSHAHSDPNSSNEDDNDDDNDDDDLWNSSS